MADYSYVPTEPLRNYLAHSTKEAAWWEREKERLEKALTVACEQVETYKRDRDEQRTELESRGEEAVPA